jgi:BlaI family transcriptional regulator, penicillinase repressor
MAKKLEQITDGELAILRVLWQRGVVTTRDITEAVYPEVTDPKMASVQKLIERLEGKGCVERDRSERAHRFRALVTQEEFLQSRLQSLADRVCGGELADLMTTLVRSKGISRSERNELRKLIDELWPSK